MNYFGRGHRLVIAALGTLIATVVLTASSQGAAATPAYIAVEARLEAGGGAAPDGNYGMIISLYAAKTGGAALWSETHLSVTAKNGAFSLLMGSKKALPATLSNSKELWLGVQIGNDPELPRRQVHATFFARHAATADAANTAKNATTAAVASDLKCVGCVDFAEMKFPGDVDLSASNLKVKSLISVGEVKAAVFLGDGSKLTGIKIPAGTCASGSVMTGIAADGTVKCAAGVTGNKVLGGLLSSEFTENAPAPKLPLDIPDNTGASAAAIATFGKVGNANSFEITVEVTNTDLSNVSIKLLPPQDKAKGMTVCDPCGKKDEKLYKAVLTEKSALKSGSLGDYIGKAVDGAWTLTVQDTAFCLPQLNGNAALCDTTNKLDGQLKQFTVSAKVTSSVSVNTAGTFQFGLLDKEPFPCSAAKQGHAYYDKKTKRLRFCDGAVWRSLSDTCGNGIIETGEECDDGNNTDGDGCSGVCIAAKGQTQSDPIKSCKVLKSVMPSAKTGEYWMVDGVSTRKVLCDMTTDGGGWTRFMYHSDPNGTTAHPTKTWDENITFAANHGIKEWLSKTYLEPKSDTMAGSKWHNAWVTKLSSNVVGAKFTFFKYQTVSGTNTHRYSGPGYLDSAKLLAGSSCKGWSSSHNNGRYLWGEHRWSNGNGPGQMWMSYCSNPTNYHILIVNHNYNYPPNYQTMIGAVDNKGKWNNYDENGGAFEFFFRE